MNSFYIRRTYFPEYPSAPLVNMQWSVQEPMSGDLSGGSLGVPSRKIKTCRFGKALPTGVNPEPVSVVIHFFHTWILGFRRYFSS